MECTLNCYFVGQYIAFQVSFSISQFSHVMNFEIPVPFRLDLNRSSSMEFMALVLLIISWTLLSVLPLSDISIEERPVNLGNRRSMKGVAVFMLIISRTVSQCADVQPENFQFGGHVWVL